MEELYYTYIAIPTARRHRTEEPNLKKGGEKTIKDEPFKMYAIAYIRLQDGRWVGKPPYFKVLGLDGSDTLKLEELVQETPDFNRVIKWVGDPPHSEEERLRPGRRILNASEGKHCKSYAQVVNYFKNGTFEMAA